MRVNQLPTLDNVTASRMLNGKTSRKIANNTTIRRENHGYVVRLHNTDIVTCHNNGDIHIDTGGWNTTTTISRIKHLCWAYLRNVSYAGGECTITDYDGTTTTGDQQSHVDHGWSVNV